MNKNNQVDETWAARAELFINGCLHPTDEAACTALMLAWVGANPQAPTWKVLDAWGEIMPSLMWRTAPIQAQPLEPGWDSGVTQYEKRLPLLQRAETQWVRESLY